MVSPWGIILRIVIAALLGSIIGYERDVSGHEAGLRTHMLVALASATFIGIAILFLGTHPSDLGQHTSENVSRVAAAVVTGIGFLAGGSIIHTKTSVQGLTSAAGLWLVTAIGLCCGTGMYFVAGATTILGLLALTGLHFFERRAGSIVRRDVAVEIKRDHADIEGLLDTIRELGVKISEVDYECQKDVQRVCLKFEMRMKQETPLSKVIAQLEAHPEVLSLKLNTVIR